MRFSLKNFAVSPYIHRPQLVQNRIDTLYYFMLSSILFSLLLAVVHYLRAPLLFLYAGDLALLGFPLMLYYMRKKRPEHAISIFYALWLLIIVLNVIAYDFYMNSTETNRILFSGLLFILVLSMTTMVSSSNKIAKLSLTIYPILLFLHSAVIFYNNYQISWDLQMVGQLILYPMICTSLAWTFIVHQKFVSYVMNVNIDHQEKLEETLQKRTRELETANHQLMELSLIDPLTELHNRRSAMRILSYEVSRAQRTKERFSILLMDIDNFKAINEQLGHQKADELLIRIAELLEFTVRKTDTISRWTGDQFMLICPQTPPDNSIAFAEKVSKALRTYNFGLGRPLTCSIGVYTIGVRESTDDMIKKVNDALAAAKAKGPDSIHHPKMEIPPTE